MTILLAILAILIGAPLLWIGGIVVGVFYMMILEIALIAIASFIAFIGFIIRVLGGGE